MIVVLRLGHRLKRDERVSTHCGLVARAFGAREIIYSGEKDEKMVNSIKNVTSRWGGPFKARYEKNWRKVIASYKRRKFHVIQLAMYGLPLKKRIAKIRRKKVLVIIGSEKVPGEVYALADHNIAVTSQPHSEIAALAVFLHEFSRGRERKFSKAKIRVVPQERGKRVVEK